MRIAIDRASEKAAEGASHAASKRRQGVGLLSSVSVPQVALPSTTEFTAVQAKSAVNSAPVPDALQRAFGTELLAGRENAGVQRPWPVREIVGTAGGVVQRQHNPSEEKGTNLVPPQFFAPGEYMKDIPSMLSVDYKIYQSAFERWQKTIGAYSKQTQAIDILKGCDPKLLSNKWTGLEATTVIEQAITRINKPFTTDIRGPYFCGPTLLMSVLIEKDPVHYAELVIEVLSKVTPSTISVRTPP